MRKTTAGSWRKPLVGAGMGLSFSLYMEVVQMDVVQVIQSLGFPIACVICMFAMWQKEVHAHDEEMEKMRVSLDEQWHATTEALNNNTQVLTRILERIGADN